MVCARHKSCNKIGFGSKALGEVLNEDPVRGAGLGLDSLCLKSLHCRFHAVPPEASWDLSGLQPPCPGG